MNIKINYIQIQLIEKWLKNMNKKHNVTLQ